MVKADVSHDKKLSKAEFQSVADGRFACMDKNNDGYIERSELKRSEHTMKGKH